MIVSIEEAIALQSFFPAGTHTHTHTYTHTHTHTHTYVHTHTRIHTYTYTLMHTHTVTYAHICTYTHLRNTHTHTHSHTLTHTHSLTHRPEHELNSGDITEQETYADVVVNGRTYIGGQDHFYLETNCTLAIPREHGHLEVLSSTQNPTKTQNFCASVCGLPAAHVVAKCKRMGGGFGGKETRSGPNPDPYP